MNNQHESTAAKLDALKTLELQRAALYRKLDRSLALDKLVPGVFKHGRAHSRVVGNPQNSMRFIVTDGAGNVTEFDLADVPIELWCAGSKSDIRECRTRTKYRRILETYERSLGQ